MLSGIILEIFYNGETTGEIIKPALDDLIDDILQMKQLIRTLIFTSLVQRQQEKQMIIAAWQGTSELSKTALWHLERGQRSINTYEDTVAFTSKTFGIHPWQETFYRCRDLTDLISKRTGKNKYLVCRIRKQLIQHGSEYLTIMPPQSLRLAIPAINRIWNL